MQRPTTPVGSPTTSQAVCHTFCGIRVAPHAIGPAAPASPCGPCSPADPGEPVEPDVPEVPGAPAGPGTPVAPVEPCVPSIPLLAPPQATPAISPATIIHVYII